MSALIDKLKKNSSIKDTSLLTDSKVYGKKDMVPTPVPMINVALSGRVDGGLTPGLTTIAGPSRHFKSAFALLMGAAYQKHHDDAVILFYDSEFGTPQNYFTSLGIDLDRVVHTPVTDIEQLKHDVMVQLQNIDRGDKIIVVIDSIGNLASKKEVDDAIDGKQVADMSRAKALKSLFRMITPHLTLKDIPMVVINHTYKEIGMFPKDVVAGGTGNMYSSDNIWIVGRQQDKTGTELTGYNFVINVEKSRYVKEKSKIPITVSFEGGIMKWSGLVDIAVDGNYIAKPSNGWYQKVDRESGELIGDKMRLSQIENSKEFWVEMLKQTDFAKYIEKKYSIGLTDLIESED